MRRGTITNDVWCNTCAHTHVGNIPATTWACADCGFGAWADEVAEYHATLYPDHIVHTVMHEVVAVPVDVCRQCGVALTADNVWEAGTCTGCAPETVRADADVLCPTCYQPWRNHEQVGDVPTLRWSCDPRVVVKL